MAWRWSFALILVLLLPFKSFSASIVKTLPGFEGELPFKFETGYIGVGKDEAVQLFYYFVESARDPANDPLIAWTVGGPGCTALTAFFIGSGPLQFNTSSTSEEFPTLEINPYAWTQEASIIYIDLPVGTGFSYSKTQEGWYSNDTLFIDHEYEFLTKWFINHPEFSSNPFYIGGGSYNGKIVPPLVERVYQGHIAGDIPNINIKGYIMGSPVTNETAETNLAVDYAHRMYFIPDDLYESIKTNCNGDIVNINAKNTKCLADYDTYSELVLNIYTQNVLEDLCATETGLHRRSLVEDSQTIRKFKQNNDSLCPGYSGLLLVNWVNDDTVREALHVRKGTMGTLSRCNASLLDSITYTKETYDVVEIHRRLIKTNLNVLIFCGDLDMTVPQLSTLKWIETLNLTTFEPWRPWFVGGQVAGYIKLYEEHNNYYFTYANVKESGHVPTTFKPQQVSQMVKRWLEYSII